MTRRHKAKVEPTGPTIRASDYYRHLLEQPATDPGHSTGQPTWAGYLAFANFPEGSTPDDLRSTV